MKANSILIGGMLVLAGFSPSIALESETTPEDEVGLLYSSQVNFGPDGIPLVTVGIMEGQTQVSVSSLDGLELSFSKKEGDQWVSKSLKIPPRLGLRFMVAGAIPAKVSYWCGVERIPFVQKEALQQAMETWRQRGESIQLFEVGSVFGILGHVIDNRTYILAIRSYDAEQPAADCSEEIFTRYGSKTFIHEHLTRRPSGELVIQDQTHKPLDTAKDLIQIRSLGESPILVNRVEFGKGYSWHNFEDRKFAGKIFITVDRRGTLAVVNQLSIERLLEGLVPSEIFPGAPMEALKAQAVVARGEVLAKIGSRHFLDSYRLCASTHCQVYSGVGVEQPRTSLAVKTTRGELLFLGPDLVDSVYSASCGGHTEDNDAVWSQPPSQSLRGRPDRELAPTENWVPIENRLDEWLRTSPEAFCNSSSLNRKGIFRWERVINSREMDRLVALVKPIGQVVSIQVISRGVSGRVKVIRIVGTEGDLLVQREWPIRQLFGNLKSGMFVVSIVYDQEQMPKEFHFIGGGWGHGSGMCQIGAVGMAEQGYDYRSILAHYYGNARAVKLYSNSE